MYGHHITSHYVVQVLCGLIYIFTYIQICNNMNQCSCNPGFNGTDCNSRITGEKGKYSSCYCVYMYLVYNCS